MIIEELKISKLHGAISKTVTFFSGLNLLVGINGSGKTSVLNVLNWLLKPNFVELSTNEFEELKLKVKVNGQAFIIRAIQTEKLLTITITVGAKKLHPITVALRTPPGLLRANRPLWEHQREKFKNLVPDPAEQAAWDCLASLKKPFVVSLDRTILVEQDEEVALDDGRTFRMPSAGGRPVEPMAQVSELAKNKYAAYRNEIIQLNDVLKSQIILSTFELPDSRGESTRQYNYANPAKVTKLKEKLLSQASSWKVDSSAQKSIAAYFTYWQKILKAVSSERGKSQESVYEYFSSDLLRLESLFKAFDEFERNSTKAFLPIGSYLDEVNGFFSESGKRIEFLEDNNNLVFKFTEEDSGGVIHRRNVEQLSSGEKQILILLTYIAFSNSVPTIFIIDEPELSLHPRWQRGFIGAVTRLMPIGSQVIIATHSPELVGKHKPSCVVLLPY